MIQSKFFFACIRRFRDSRGGRPLTLERVVVGSNALCSVSFLLHFFFVKRQSQTALSFWWSLDMTRSTTELLQIGLEATTFVLIRQMLSVAFEAVEVFWPVCGSYSPCADIWTPSRPPHRHGKPGDFGSLFFFVHFPRFLKFLAPRLKKIQILQCGWAVRRMIAKSAVAILRRTSHCDETARFLPPFFWRYTTPLPSRERLLRLLLDHYEYNTWNE